MKEMKVRLDPDKATDVQLWLASGTVRVSFTGLLNALLTAFHAEIAGKEPCLDVIAEAIQTSVRITHHELDQHRFPNG